MSLISKEDFIKQLNNAYVKIDYLSDRRLDYKYLEYKLFNILIKYSKDIDFSILGIPKNLQIKLFPGEDDYDISRMTHVTLNAELYRFYDCGYYSEKDFINYVITTIDIYKSGSETINSLVKKIRKIRLDYTNTISNIIQMR